MSHNFGIVCLSFPSELLCTRSLSSEPEEESETCVIPPGVAFPSLAGLYSEWVNEEQFILVPLPPIFPTHTYTHTSSERDEWSQTA